MIAEKIEISINSKTAASWKTENKTYWIELRRKK